MTSSSRLEQQRLAILLNSKTAIILVAIVALMSAYDAYSSRGLMMSIEMAKAAAAIAFLFIKRSRFAIAWCIILLTIAAFMVRRML